MSKSVFAVVLAFVAVSCSSALAQCCNNQNVVCFGSAPMVTETFQSPVVWDSGYSTFQPTFVQPAIVENTWNEPEAAVATQYAWSSETSTFAPPVYYSPSSCCCSQNAAFIQGEMVLNGQLSIQGEGVVFNNEAMIVDESAITTFEVPSVETLVEGEVVESTFTSDASVIEAPVESEVNETVEEEDIETADEDEAVGSDTELNEDDELTEDEDALEEEADDFTDDDDREEDSSDGE